MKPRCQTGDHIAIVKIVIIEVTSFLDENKGGYGNNTTALPTPLAVRMALDAAR
jgi:hypothetical protein